MINAVTRRRKSTVNSNVLFVSFSSEICVIILGIFSNN